jgi:hypothetical protein
VSAESPTPAKASRNFADSAAMRRSHEKASEAPAPAAVPFTAAITGFGSVVSARTSGA